MKPSREIQQDLLTLEDEISSKRRQIERLQDELHDLERQETTLRRELEEAERFEALAGDTFTHRVRALLDAAPLCWQEIETLWNAITDGVCDWDYLRRTLQRHHGWLCTHFPALA
jgi:Chromosome segregation ATPases